MRLWQRIFLVSFAVIMVMTGVISGAMMHQQLMGQLSTQEDVNQQLHENIWLDLGRRIKEAAVENDVIVFDGTWERVLYRLRADDMYKGQSMAVAVSDLESVMCDGRTEDGRAVFMTEGWMEPTGETTEWMWPEPGRMLSRIGQVGGDIFYVSVSCGELYGRTVYVGTKKEITDWIVNYDRQLGSLRFMIPAVSFFAGIILLLFTKWSLRPLAKVVGEIHEISEGNYGKRLEVGGHSEIAELAAGVDIMSEKIAENMHQLAEASERQKQFMHNMAHEMKTPLTSIIGFSDILSIKPDISTQEVREYGEIISKEAKRLEELSAKLMALFHMQQGSIDRMPVALDERLTAVIKSMQPMMEGKNLQLSVTLQQISVMGDVALLDSLFYNLLDNARKACEQGGHIDVRLSGSEGESRLTIADDGIGMTDETIERISEPFYMADKARSRSEGGAGLGMALCREIVHLHGARWEIESSPGRGSRISIVWPKPYGPDVVDGEEQL